MTCEFLTFKREFGVISCEIKKKAILGWPELEVDILYSKYLIRIGVGWFETISRETWLTSLANYWQWCEKTPARGQKVTDMFVNFGCSPHTATGGYLKTCSVLWYTHTHTPQLSCLSPFKSLVSAPSFPDVFYHLFRTSAILI